MSAELAPATPEWFSPDHVAALFYESGRGDDAADDHVLEAVRARLASLSDEAAIAWLARAYVRHDEVSFGLKCAAQAMETELERRLRERMTARGNDVSEIAIPHPLVEVVLAPQFGPYEPDVDTLRNIAVDPALDEKERAKLVKVIPAHTEPEVVIPAKAVPEQVLPGNVAAIMAVARKYAGSTIGRAIELAMPRKRLSDKFIIRRKKVEVPRG